jgi:hypothetical protein
VAAAAFRSLLGARFDRVIVIGPSHYAGFRGAAVPDADACATPLGGIPLDAPAVARLLDAPGFRRDNRPFAREHCLEAELPFLQRTLRSGFRLVPVLVGSGTVGAVADQVAAGLAPLCDPATLVVVSSDFTHYGAAFGYVPFRERVPDRIRELDFGVVERILSGDAVAFEAHLERTGATVCGRDAIGVLLRLLAPGSVADLLAYDTSSRMTGDWSHTVSYAAIAFRAARA